MTMAYELLGIFLKASPCSVRFAIWFQASRSGLMLLHDYDHEDYLELGADESGIDALQDRIDELQDRINGLEEREDIHDELGDPRVD